MTLDLHIPLPRWVIPKRIKDDLRQRAQLTGTAATELSFCFLGLRVASTIECIRRNQNDVLTP